MLAYAAGPWGKLQIERIVPTVESVAPVFEMTSRLMVEKNVTVDVVSFRNDTIIPDSNDSVFKKSVAQSLNQLQSLQKQLQEYRKELGVKQIHKQVISTVEQVQASELCINWAEEMSIAFDGSKYYLMVVDKTTEYYAAFPTASRTNMVELVKHGSPRPVASRASSEWTVPRSLSAQLQ